MNIHGSGVFMSINQKIAKELKVSAHQVNAAVTLLDEGATVPFIARYRKEVTGGLDDTQLRMLEERLRYLRDLESRRDSILKSIGEQEKLTPELEKAIRAADTMARLEDLYLPYKPKRRTKAEIARKAGLEPLAHGLLADATLEPEAFAAAFVDADKGVADTKAALEGARQILMEEFGEDADLIAELRNYLQNNAVITCTVYDDKRESGAKFSDYFDYSEALKKIPSHRALAIFRGRNESVLMVKMLEEAGAEERVGPGYCEGRIACRFGIANKARAADAWLLETARWAWKVKIFLRLELDLFGELRGKAEEEAIRVFGDNLRDLLLAAPAGQRATIGLDPGLRTGVKVAVVDHTGKLLETTTIFPHVPHKRWQESIAALAVLSAKHHVDLIAIGNGTASRETEALAKELRDQFPNLHLTQVVVSEAGASVYSASETAAKEFPNLDVSLRGAVSIARRLQDPLAELVKIDPKSIGVGQYQHDVSQLQLARKLDAVVEDCVNSVGVDINTASVPLLTHVAGLNRSVAEKIVAYRDAQGIFLERKKILDVPGIGPKSFEQAAGFLRIINGKNPLDASAVHPEAYPVVERIVAASNKPIKEIIGNREFIQQLKAKDFTDERFGVITVGDIFAELEKPGRDPRPQFKTAKFKDGVHDVRDLRVGMLLEGTVTNVANFGAFVDVGVHQDGLVHVSALTDKFIDDPRKVVKTGDVVKVKVLEVDVKRKRISLTMRLDDPVGAAAAEKPKKEKRAKPDRVQQKLEQNLNKSKNAPQSAMAAAFAKAVTK
ncbi:MAG: RNA-binding transcriptional accessory protein [Zetaproteobacteria bacterium CG1_02_49_23]|nr:MAG: RNA-binding transcriptional accessory protein [Zetaproteobacteria bacterium CG1_02_49_23]